MLSEETTGGEGRPKNPCFIDQKAEDREEGLTKVSAQSHRLGSG